MFISNKSYKIPTSFQTNSRLDVLSSSKRKTPKTHWQGQCFAEDPEDGLCGLLRNGDYDTFLEQMDTLLPKELDGKHSLPLSKEWDELDQRLHIITLQKSDDTRIFPLPDILDSQPTKFASIFRDVLYYCHRGDQSQLRLHSYRILPIYTDPQHLAELLIRDSKNEVVGVCSGGCRSLTRSQSEYSA